MHSKYSIDILGLEITSSFEAEIVFCLLSLQRCMRVSIPNMMKVKTRMGTKNDRMHCTTEGIQRHVFPVGGCSRAGENVEVSLGVIISLESAA